MRKSFLTFMLTLLTGVLFAQQPLDEPLSNLDTKLRVETRQEIRRIQKETGVTAIFVTHDQEEAMSISDQIVLMKDGAIEQVSPPTDMYLIL